MRLSLAAAATCALSFAASAYAQPAPAQLFVSPMGEPFRAETDAAAPIHAWFAAADADQDGRLSRDEFVAQAMAFFRDTLDANGDRNATSIESTTLWRERAPEMLATRMAPPRPPRQPSSGLPDPHERRPRPERDPGAQSGAGAFGLLGAAEPVMTCDADRSRLVSVSEFEACAARRFAQLDTDADGFFALADSPRALELASPPS